MNTAIYHYHPDTGEYLGSSDAVVDPLDPDNIIVPAHATKNPVPNVDVNQTAVHSPDDSWSVVADYRGTSYWLADGSEHAIETLGITPPPDALDAAPPPSVPKAAAEAIDIINRQCDDAGSLISAGYPETEVKTWLKQEAEARAWLVDSTAAVPLITSMATSRGITIADLVQRIITKADAYAGAAGAVVGARQAKEDQITAIVARNALEVTALEYLDDDAARAAIEAVI